MVQYLKKTKIRSILLGLGVPVLALKDCSYRFYRGSEWLRFDDYEVYVTGSYMSINRLFYDELEDKYYTLERRVISGKNFTALVGNV